MPFKKGESGNLAGRPKTGVRDLVKLHPQRNELVQKLFDVAMNDTDKRQVSAWRILLPKMVPDLKAMQMEVEQTKITGVIILPEKTPLDPPKVSIRGQGESYTILPDDESRDGADTESKKAKSGPKDSPTEEKDSLSKQVDAVHPKVDEK